MITILILQIEADLSKQEVMEEACKTYFSTWNSHDGAAVAALFTPDGSLRDWDIEVSGAAAVGEANANIFKAVPQVMCKSVPMQL